MNHIMTSEPRHQNYIKYIIQKKKQQINMWQYFATMKSRKTRSRLDLVKRFYITNGLFENASNNYLAALSFGDNETEPTQLD